MAAVYRKRYPIAMPEGAEVVTRRGRTVARWTNGKGQKRTAEVLADGRVQFVSDCWYLRYRDATGKMRRRSSGCRDKQAAEKMLADTLADVEKVKAGVMSHREMTAAGQLDTPIGKHIEEYLRALSRKTVRGRRMTVGSLCMDEARPYVTEEKHARKLLGQAALEAANRTCENQSQSTAARGPTRCSRGAQVTVLVQDGSP